MKTYYLATIIGNYADEFDYKFNALITETEYLGYRKALEAFEELDGRHVTIYIGTNEDDEDFEPDTVNFSELTSSEYSTIDNFKLASDKKVFDNILEQMEDFVEDIK